MFNLGIERESGDLPFWFGRASLIRGLTRLKIPPLRLLAGSIWSISIPGVRVGDIIDLSGPGIVGQEYSVTGGVISDTVNLVPVSDLPSIGGIEFTMTQGTGQIRWRRWGPIDVQLAICAASSQPG